MPRIIDSDGHVMDQQYTEGHTSELCRSEIHELLMREDLSDADKQAVLADNAERFYPLAR